MDSLRDTFRDSHEAADQLAESLREHVDETAAVVALGAGSTELADVVAERLGMNRLRKGRVPRTVVIVAERIRRIAPLDALIARLLHAGAERLVIATPLAESGAAYQVDDRADAFVCLRRTAQLGRIGAWYDHWTFGRGRPSARVVPIRKSLRAVV